MCVGGWQEVPNKDYKDGRLQISGRDKQTTGNAERDLVKSRENTNSKERIQVLNEIPGIYKWQQ